MYLNGSIELFTQYMSQWMVGQLHLSEMKWKIITKEEIYEDYQQNKVHSDHLPDTVCPRLLLLKPLKHWNMEYTTTLRICSGILHQDVCNRSLHFVFFLSDQVMIYLKTSSYSSSVMGCFFSIILLWRIFKCPDHCRHYTWVQVLEMLLEKSLSNHLTITIFQC